MYRSYVLVCVIFRDMFLLSQPAKHPLLRPTLSSKSKNVVARCSYWPDWRQVGELGKLHTYPLAAGREVNCSKCNFTPKGMTGMLNDAKYPNHMFLVYDCKTNYIIQDNEMTRNVSVKYLSTHKVRIRNEFWNFGTDLIIETIKIIIMGKKVMCTTSFCQEFVAEIKCLDCGPEAAAWISRCLMDINARLAYIAIDVSEFPSPFWKKYQQLFSKQLNDCKNITIPSESLPIYSLIPCPLREKFSFNVTRAVERRVHKPHMYIKTNHVHDVCEWKWMMIGNVILRNTKPRPARSKRHINWQDMPLQKLLRFLPLQCEMIIPGQVEVGDCVYIKTLKRKY